MTIKTWIKEFDFYRFGEEVKSLSLPIELAPDRAYAAFTGVSDRHFFDYVLNETIVRDISSGSGKAGVNIIIAKDELSDFNERLRTLNSILFASRYVQETEHLIVAEFAIQVRKSKIPVSAVIPTYNPHPPALKKCIASVLYSIDATDAAQSSEIIVVDDCSPNSEDIKSLLQTSFPNERRIKYFRLNTNSGVSTARNVGISNAAHNIVFFIDHDDTVEQLHINLGAQEIERGGVDIVATNMRFPDKHIFTAHLSPRVGFLIENGFGSGIALNKGSPRVKTLLGSGEIYNTLNKAHFEDWELNSVAKLLGWRIVIVPYASYFYEYAETGRDSTNLSLKRRSALVTPLHAIQRIKKLSTEQAYSHMSEYCEYLIQQLMETETRMDAVNRETQNAKSAEGRMAAALAHTRDSEQHLKVSLENEIARKKNLLASAKDLFKELELLLAPRKVLFTLYRLTLRPVVYFVYRATRFIFRVLFGHGCTPALHLKKQHADTL